MIPRNGTLSSNGGRPMPTSIRPKKKPAPPRPPQPKINRLQPSQSFNTAQELSSGRQNFIGGRPTGKDLIDFSTPPSSPGSNRRNTIANISNAVKDPNDFSYRVGASIFYVKSQLKNSVSQRPIQNPFSPPRPSAETVHTLPQKSTAPTASGLALQSNINAAWTSATTSSNSDSAWGPVSSATSHQPSTNNNISKPTGTSGASAFRNSSFQPASSLDNNNTIKSHYQNQSAWMPAGVSSSSNASSNRSTASFSDFGGQSSQPRYGNVPEIGKKELTGTLSSGSADMKIGAKPRAPTIIRPATKISAQLSNPPTNFDKLPISAPIVHAEPEQRNYYDLPPEDEDDDDDDDDPADSSFVSPPMPSEPPPPPPVDLAVDEWVNSTTGVTDYPDTYSDAGQVTAYAIALYDFTPEAAGDLTLQAGDLVYLLRRVDDSWFQGSCGGMEGLFPSNFVNVVVPLPEESVANHAADVAEVAEEDTTLFIDVLYDFNAEAEGDLDLQVGEKVKVLGRINEDWLYGEKNGTKGQFPEAFVDYISSELPIIKI